MMVRIKLLLLKKSSCRDLIAASMLFFLFDNAFAATTPPPPPTQAVSSSGEVSLSPSSVQMDEVKNLFKNADYKNLKKRKNRQEHLTTEN